MSHDETGDLDGGPLRLSRRRYLRTAGAFATASTLGIASDEVAAATELTTDVTTATLDHEWTTVRLSREYENPVAIALPASYQGGNPSTTRLRNVDGASFDAAIEEWDYFDGWHTEETVGCLVSEAGVWDLDDGGRFAVGTLETNHQWGSATFPLSFDGAPVVFTQSQTYHGTQPVTTRNRDVGRSGFDVRIQEEEGLDGTHARERIGYVALEPGTGTIEGRPYEAGTAVVDDGWQSVSFDRAFNAPALFADVQTFSGANACGLRYRNLSGSGVDLFVEEEASADGETWHADERVGYLVVETALSAPRPTGYGVIPYGDGEYGN